FSSAESKGGSPACHAVSNARRLFWECGGVREGGVSRKKRISQNGKKSAIEWRRGRFFVRDARLRPFSDFGKDRPLAVENLLSN
ncbi:MAG: hypothetical protein WA735_01095, partial [Candidatus Acidiferrales bacterium]